MRGKIIGKKTFNSPPYEYVEEKKIILYSTDIVRRESIANIYIYSGKVNRR